MTSVRIGAGGVLAIVPAADGTASAAIHDRIDMSFSAVCSTHGVFHTIRYTHGTTESERDWCRKNIEYTATLHAADHDDTSRPGREGGQQP